MCYGLRMCSIECIHPSQRCVTQRVVTRNIFEIDTAAVALRTRFFENPGVLLTDIFCAYPSVDRRWMFLVLERAGAPPFQRRFLRGIYKDSITSVEHASMMRGVRQGFPASGYLFTMAFRPSLQMAHVCFAAGTSQTVAPAKKRLRVRPRLRPRYGFFFARIPPDGGNGLLAY